MVSWTDALCWPSSSALCPGCSSGKCAGRKQRELRLKNGSKSIACLSTSTYLRVSAMDMPWTSLSGDKMPYGHVLLCMLHSVTYTCINVVTLQCLLGPSPQRWVAWEYCVWAGSLTLGWQRHRSTRLSSPQYKSRLVTLCNSLIDPCCPECCFLFAGFWWSRLGLGVLVGQPLLVCHWFSQEPVGSSVH